MSLKLLRQFVRESVSPYRERPGAKKIDTRNPAPGSKIFVRDREYEVLENDGKTLLLRDLDTGSTVKWTPWFSSAESEYAVSPIGGGETVKLPF